MNLQVTEVKTFKIKNPTSKVVGKASITLNESLRLTSLKIIQGCNGLFIGYPLDVDSKTDEHKDAFFPITSELRNHIEESIIKEWEKLN